MHSLLRPFCLCILLAAVALVAGCSVLGISKGNPPASASNNRVMRGAAQLALSEGIELYDKGNFNGAIKRLSGSADIWAADKAIQTEALKYMAFSYCVTSRQTLCRQQFEKAFRIDPAFDLAPGEKGHPLWTQAFERAKKG